MTKHSWLAEAEWAGWMEVWLRVDHDQIVTGFGHGTTMEPKPDWDQIGTGSEFSRN